MEDAPWKHQFPQVYQKVRQIPLAKNLSPAQWMFLSLENHFISSSEYLSWAENYYGLATLKSSFFESPHFSSVTYYKFKNQIPIGSSIWGPQALPVFEWDNILFVACIDPYSVPTQVTQVINQSGMICRPLLANYEDLVKAWNLCLESGTPPPTLNLASTMTPTQQTQQKIQKQIAAGSPLVATTEPPVDPPPHELIKSSDPGLKNATKAVVPPQKLELTINSPAPTEDLFELLSSTIENVSGSRISTSSETQHSEGDHSTGESDNHGSIEMPEGLNFTINTELQLKKSPATTTVSVATPPTTKTTADSFAEPGTKSTTRTFSSPPPLSPNAPPMKVIQSQELEEELTLGFTKAYQFYRNLMILKLKDNMALPVRWDPSYKKPKSLQGISLNEPSIFRIVARTKKPFHGPITSNAINDQFIEYWFDGHKPKYLTIHPLFFEKECVGLLLGASDETLDRKDSLHLMESTAEMIEINFGANLAAA